MTLLFLTNGEEGKGIALAWAMATLGTLLTQRRHLLKSISAISIPETCQLIVSPSAPLPLRISSNLLYGMSLIYRQKVSHMLNDLASVSARLAVPSFTEIPTTGAPEAAAKKITARQTMRDDARFNIAEDFAPSFELEPTAALDAVLQIMEQDQQLNEIDPSNVNLAAAADERDRLFEKFLEKSFASIHMDQDDGYDVDFDFDQNGEIVQQGGEGTTADVLQDLNLDQDFHAVAGTIEELLKTQNTGTNDPHFSTTAQNAAPTLEIEAPRKRRKTRFHKDGDLTFRAGPLTITSRVKQLNVGSLKDMVEFVSRTTPNFVNSCYMAVFGPAATSFIPLDRFPLTHRHASTSHIPLRFHELMGIEEGRNYIRPNVSFDNIDNLPRNQDYADGQFPDIDFDFDLNFSPDISLEVAGQDNEDGLAFAKMLSKFRTFVQSKLGELSEKMLTFEELVPSKATETERPVNRKFVASAFAYILQLATLDQLQIQCNSEEDQFNLTGDIYIFE